MENKLQEQRNHLFGGLILLAVGLVALLNQFFDIPIFENLGIFFLSGLGLIFLLWGIFTREAGLMIPGGILSGIGLGIVLINGPFGATAGDQSGAIFMLAFAVGWFSIPLFTALFTDETHWWPLIPGAIMALIGGALLFQGPFMGALELLGMIWPLALIIGGVALLLGARKAKQPDLDSLSNDDLKALEKENS